MGVKICGRYRCDAVMCDQLILDNSAYICDACFDELLEFKETWPDKMPIANVRARIQEFMLTPPGTYALANSDQIDAEFYRLTGGE